MKKSYRWTTNAAQLCAEIGAEDGVDPRYIKTKQARKNASCKNLQLCKEASRIVSLVLAGETGQPLLRDLQVLSVQAEHDGQQLCVALGHYAADIQVSPAQLQNALASAQSQVRWALAQALHRKHVPAIRFRYIGLLNQEDSPCLF